MIDTNRLATDAGYWGECGAPEDATHYCSHQEKFVSLKRINVCQCDIPRPQSEWVDGLPPVGADLEYDTHFGNWCPAKCIARGHEHDDAVAVIQTTNRMFIVSDSDRVRIRRAKAQRDRDELADMISYRGVLSIGEGLELAEAIIAAGWTKQ